MPRNPRVLADDGHYHLLARGNNRLFLFEVPEGFETFRRLLARAKARYRWRLFHYCLMIVNGSMSKRAGSELPRRT